MRVRTFLVVLAAALFALPSVALAATEPTSTPPASIHATGTGYELDFTLPTAAKAGCSVCHGDPDLARLQETTVTSYFIDPAIVDASAHAAVQCSSCHVDFAFVSPHVLPEGFDWRAEAKSVCRNCHRESFIDYGGGSHRPLPEGSTEESSGPRPLCGDCHGDHAISMITSSTAGQEAIHRDGYEVCGRCHQDYWDNYNDYWHGEAYKNGALDAPACWDCHGYHEVLPASNSNSMVSERHLAETCGACHGDSDNEDFLAYAELIHGTKEAQQQVPIYEWIADLLSPVLGLFGS